MGVQSSFENIGRALARPPQSHPHAHGSFGWWLIQKKPAPPLGFVITGKSGGGYVMHAYAYCRDEGGRRPWLQTADSLNSPVAWMMQHEAEIRALISRSTPEPDASV